MTNEKLYCWVSKIQENHVSFDNISNRIGFFQFLKKRKFVKKVKDTKEIQFDMITLKSKEGYLNLILFVIYKEFIYFIRIFLVIKKQKYSDGITTQVKSFLFLKIPQEHKGLFTLLMSQTAKVLQKPKQIFMKC